MHILITAILSKINNPMAMDILKVHNPNKVVIIHPNSNNLKLYT